VTLDLDQARFALQLCQGAYNLSKIPTGPEWSKPALIIAQFLPGKLIMQNPLFGYAIRHGRQLHVAFRGTQNPEDWLSDFRCEPDVDGVHGGIAAVYDSLQASMVEAISSLSAFPPLPIEYTGHSLGGALATIAAASTPGSTSITFAAPRVFTAARAKSLPVDGIRIVNERDIVPHLPGRMGIWSFEHRAQAFRFAGRSFDFCSAHSLEKSYGPALSGELQGPMDLD
jgi:Lipase (class 3)